MPPSTCSGFWPEGGRLDQLDKSVSRQVFRAELPWFLEVCLTIPGAWFGCPLYALVCVPLITGMLCPQSNISFRCVAGVCVFCGFVYWCLLCRRSLRAEEGRGVKEAFAIMSPKFMCLVPQVVYAVAFTFGEPHVARAVVQYATSWFISILVCEVFKGICWRSRPIAGPMADELWKVQRSIRDLTNVVNKPAQANLSFPSGDAAGGGVFFAIVVGASPRLTPVAAIISILCSAGRVYFHCHHCVDVLVGMTLGACVSTFIGSFFNLDWMFLCFVQLTILGLWKPVQKLKPAGAAKMDLRNHALDPDKK